MSQRSVSGFKSTKDTRYADNANGEISAADSRDMFEDVADSFVNWIDGVKDEDDMASDSASHVPTQQSVKKYVDNKVAGVGTIVHKRVTTGSITASSAANITVTWDTPFADANYTVVATLDETTETNYSEFYVERLINKTKDDIDVRVQNKSVSAKTATINIIAIHD